MHVSNTEGLHSTVSSCRTAERERVLVLYLELLTACFSSFLGIYCSLTHVLPTGKKKKRKRKGNVKRGERTGKISQPNNLYSQSQISL